MGCRKFFAPEAVWLRQVSGPRILQPHNFTWTSRSTLQLRRGYSRRVSSGLQVVRVCWSCWWITEASLLFGASLGTSAVLQYNIAATLYILKALKNRKHSITSRSTSTWYIEVASSSPRQSPAPNKFEEIRKGLHCIYATGHNDWKTVARTYFKPQKVRAGPFSLTPTWITSQWKHVGKLSSKYRQEALTSQDQTVRFINSSC